jgi:hypothetical protein
MPYGLPGVNANFGAENFGAARQEKTKRQRAKGKSQ